MNPIGILVLAVALTLVVFAKRRRWAVFGSMIGILFVTQGQAVIALGLNIFAIRILELVGFIRVIARRELRYSMLNSVDRAVILVYGYTTFVFLLRSPDGQANQIGIALDAVLTYFMYRGLVTDLRDLKWFLKMFLLLLAPYTALVLVESFTKQNPFSFMGGVVLENWIREGQLRCQGSFRHPSLLGTLGASFLSLYIALALAPGVKRYAWFGIGLCLTIVWASNSGGPANFAAMVFVGWILWPLRTRMRLLRIAIGLGVLVLALVMKAPIWFLLAKVSAVSGGDGWHRSFLMDVTYHNLGKWWLAGMPLRETQGWFPYDLGATGGADITNLFLSFALTGGLVAMILFIRLLVLVFSYLGRALDRVRADPPDGGESQFFLWALGTMLVGHIFNWLGITYFDQTYALWSFQLATIVGLSQFYFSAPNGDDQTDLLEAEENAEWDEFSPGNAQLRASWDDKQPRDHEGWRNYSE